MAEVEMGDGPDVVLSDNTVGQDQDPTQAQESRPKKTRNRLPVSCEPCRIRRAKCGRERPHCSTCSKRGEMEKCVYRTQGPKLDAKTDDLAGRIPVAETEARLRNLEAIIGQALQGRKNSGYQNQPSNGYAMPQTPADPSDASEPGALAAIAADLQELRALITGDYGSGPADPYEEMTVLFGATQTPSLDFTLSQYLPDRSEVEALLATYFRAPFLVVPVVHADSFQTQLREFWQTKPNVDPIWAGLLFALLTLAAHITSVASGNASSAPDRFAHAAAQCISLGGFTRPKKHLIPALLLLAQSQYVRRLDPSREVRMILTVLADLGFQSGLHREPPRNVSVFEAEMRRRLWYMIRHFEVQIASQFGVPTVIPYNSFDVKEPRNLNDEDLKEDMTVLPESRDLSEHTSLAAFLVKARLMSIFSEVYHHAMSIGRDLIPNPENLDAIMMRLDADIRREHASIPPRYQIRPISESYADNEGLVLARLTFEFLTQKTLCILHRRRMAEGNDSYSRKACIDAASKIIKETTDLIPEFGAGRQLQGKSWILTSTIVNDFLLAAMILCLAVATEDRASTSTPTTSRRRGNNTSNTNNEAERTRRLIDLLMKSRNLCIELSPRSRGAKRVGEAITTLLQRVQQNANLDPSLSSNYAAINANGYAGVNSYLPTPTPSSTVSQERSTHAQTRHQQQQQQQGGYDYAANIAAAAQAEPLPVPMPGQGQGQSLSASSVGGDQLVAAALYAASQPQIPPQSLSPHHHAQQQHQQPIATPASIDPFSQYMNNSDDAEVDWTAFDQFIFNEGVSGSGGVGTGYGGGVGVGFGAGAGAGAGTGTSGFDWNNYPGPANPGAGATGGFGMR